MSHRSASIIVAATLICAAGMQSLRAQGEPTQEEVNASDVLGENPPELDLLDAGGDGFRAAAGSEPPQATVSDGAQSASEEEEDEDDAADGEDFSDADVPGGTRAAGRPAGLQSIFKLFGRGGEDEAETESAQGDDDRVRKLKELASENVRKGRVTEAMQNANELIILRPYDPEFHLALGLCFRRVGKFDDARKKYQDVLDLGGPKSLISLLLAEAYAALNDRTKVLEHLREAAIGGRNVINDVGLIPRLNVYQDDTEFIKLALQLEKFELPPSRKHDPFTNPFPKKVEGPDDDLQRGGAVAQVELSPQEQERLLQEAKNTYGRVQFYIKIENEDKAMRAYNQLREYFAQRELITVPKIANDFRYLMTRMEDLEVQIEGIRLKFYYNQAKEKLATMKENFLDGEYSKVQAVFQEVQKLATEMRQANTRYTQVAERIVATAEQWVRRAQVRQEFESRKPRIQGIVIGEDGKMAVLNDRVVRQGEAIDEFRVVKVESNRVTFRYKGEEIPLTFRRY